MKLGEVKRQNKEAQLKRKLGALVQHDAELLLTCEADTLIAGVDEVGRGSLIGPVVAACVVFPVSVLNNIPETLIGLDDSKATHLNHLLRSQLAEVIRENALVYAIAEATQLEVETLNVSQASLLAGKRALSQCVESLTKIPESIIVLMDGRQPLKGLDFKSINVSSKAIIKGDALSLSIAAASVLAKVHRDNWVLDLCRKDPDLEKYGFKTNMGYATPPHRKAILSDGATKYHRQTFLGKILAEQLLLQV